MVNVKRRGLDKLGNNLTEKITNQAAELTYYIFFIFLTRRSILGGEVK
ncbi:MAG: hypothetical protein GWN62_05265 [Aliifodinibius sp.]|nr:hypothetical protein [Fodinibius sp.]